MTHQEHIHTVTQYVPTGVTYMTTILSTLIGSAISAALAWYIRGRGMTGVQNDLNNVKNDVETLKNRVFTPAPFVAATVATQ